MLLSNVHEISLIIGACALNNCQNTHAQIRRGGPKKTADGCSSNSNNIEERRKKKKAKTGFPGGH